MQKQAGDRVSGVGRLSCNKNVAESSPGSEDLSQCALGQDTSPGA